MKNGERQLNKEEKAFIQELYHSYFKVLLNCARRLGFRDEVAEDYVQETFLIAMNRVEVVQNCKNPLAYLVKVLKNTIGYNLRCAQYASRMMKKLQDKEADIPTDGTYHVELEPDALYHGSISDEELRLLIRFYLEGWTSKELAEDMGINFEACKKRILRAREHLRRVLEESDKS